MHCSGHPQSHLIRLIATNTHSPSPTLLSPPTKVIRINLITWCKAWPDRECVVCCGPSRTLQYLRTMESENQCWWQRGDSFKERIRIIILIQWSEFTKIDNVVYQPIPAGFQRSNRELHGDGTYRGCSWTPPSGRLVHASAISGHLWRYNYDIAH